jgi:hypothetical protein
LPGDASKTLCEATIAMLEDARFTKPHAKLKVFSKYAKEIDPDTGKVLDHTDIDFIVDDGTNLIYYQAKSTARAFKDGAIAAQREAERWVNLARADAVQNGITNQVIKYVVPPDVVVPLSVVTYFNQLAARPVPIIIQIVRSPLLR